MSRDYEQANQWLTQNIGKPLVISKREKQIGGNKISTEDKIKIMLERVSVRDADYVDSDNYVAPRELILHGRGQILSTEGHFPLPQRAFEIPLTGDVVAKDSSLGLEIETDRTVYSIRSGRVKH
jgi:hypothetical protein